MHPMVCRRVRRPNRVGADTFASPRAVLRTDVVGGLCPAVVEDRSPRMNGVGLWLGQFFVRFSDYRRIVEELSERCVPAAVGPRLTIRGLL